MRSTSSNGRLRVSMIETNNIKRYNFLFFGLLEIISGSADSI